MARLVYRLALLVLLNRRLRLSHMFRVSVLFCFVYVCFCASLSVLQEFGGCSRCWSLCVSCFVLWKRAVGDGVCVRKGGT